MKIYKARTIGLFFLLAFIAYGIGQYWFESEILIEKYVGAVLIAANSTIVLLIGVLLKQTLQRYNALAGKIYLITRVLESIALASILLNLIPTISVPYDLGYSVAMLILGLGSIPMCLTLYKQKIATPWLAVWGVIGYAVFFIAILIELIGIEWSMYLQIPGALWEISFAIWLIINSKRK